MNMPVAEPSAEIKQVRAEVQELRSIVQKAHAETISSRESVNANSVHMIKMCDLITEQYSQISRTIDANTAITMQGAKIAKQALDLAQKTAKDNEGLFEFYQTSKKTVDAVQRATVKSWLTTKLITLKASRTARVLIPIVSLTAFGLAWWRGEPLHFKDIREILEALK